MKQHIFMNSLFAVVQKIWLNFMNIIQRCYHYQINFIHYVFNRKSIFVRGVRIDANDEAPGAIGSTIEKVEWRLRWGMRVNHLFPLSLFRFHLVKSFTNPQTIYRQVVEGRSKKPPLCLKLPSCHPHYFGSCILWKTVAG